MCASQWATEVKVLFCKLDLIVGRDGTPVEALAIAAERGERALVVEQADYVKKYSNSLKDLLKHALDEYVDRKCCIYLERYRCFY